MTISQILLPEFDQETASTRKILQSVPEDKFSWKPHAKSMTLGRLASHVAELGSWAAITVNQDKLELTPDQKPLNAASAAELLAAFEKAAADGRAAIEGASDEKLLAPWTLVYDGKTVFTLPKKAVLRGMVMNHMVHHRGQLSVYLRLLDIPVPGMYGPSADEKGAFGA
ncbi:MAG: DinB family protein [Acidobacteriota bacterium]